MQASTNSASLEIQGDINGFKTGDGSELSANSKIQVSNFKDSSFIKPWSDNVSVFFGLYRFSKKTFAYNEDSKKARGILTSEGSDFELRPVSALDIF